MRGRRRATHPAHPVSVATIWRPSADDKAALLLIAVLPILIALPEIVGYLQADPILRLSGLARTLTPGLLPGHPYIDPNDGLTNQALGRLAARDWLHGVVPWWNPFSGVGMPLAAEFQPAVFFPPTLLLLLPNGPLWLHLSLQILTGWGTYALLRQLGFAPLAAGCGGSLFALNGTLSWFAHSPANVACLLPWILLGVERAAAKGVAGLPGGWRLLALAFAAMLLAGFPETAFICGLFALAWAFLRLAQCARRFAIAWRLALGCGLGLALAGPQLVAFLIYLPRAFLDRHTSGFAHASLDGIALLPSLLMPYVFGPIFAYREFWPRLGAVWNNVGGYTDAVLLTAAMSGFMFRGTALAWLLLGWSALTLAKSFGVEPIEAWWNVIPGIPETAFYRYSAPTWEFATIVLAATAIDALCGSAGQSRARGWLAAAMAGSVICLAGTYLVHLWPMIPTLGGQRKWFHAVRPWVVVSAAWAVVTVGLAVAIVSGQIFRRRAAIALATLLVCDSSVMLGIPTLGNFRNGAIDESGLRFLSSHIGLHRFLTLAALQPNYSAYFGVASINHNALPVPRRWVDWIHGHLDPAADPIVFIGNRHADGTRPADLWKLTGDPAAYEWLGVKYILVPPGQNPFAGVPGLAATPAYTDSVMSIFRLPHPAPYFQSVPAGCSIDAKSRTSATVQCPAASTLVRRELFFPGWSALVGGRQTAITAWRNLFQAIAVPAGRSVIAFAYAPPYTAAAWLVALAAAASIAASLLVERRRAPAIVA